MIKIHNYDTEVTKDIDDHQEMLIVQALEMLLKDKKLAHYACPAFHESDFGIPQIKELINLFSGEA